LKLNTLLVISTLIMITAAGCRESMPDGIPGDLDTEEPCSYCHGAPPQSPHSQISNCYICHPSTVDTDNSILIGSGFHIDGVKQYIDIHPEEWEDPARHGYTFYEDTVYCQDCHGLSYDGGDSGSSCNDCHIDYIPDWKTDCTFCHGGTDNQQGSPPEGVHGETLPSDQHVGAHTVHVMESLSHNGWDCTLCHNIEYSSFADPGHIEGVQGAEVELSSEAGVAAAYDRETASCGAIYCHGNGDKSGATVIWTSPDPMTCDSCHGNPPPFPHTPLTDCVLCHDSTVTDTNDVDLSGKTHIDGILQTSLPDTCNECHGSEANAAPPVSTTGSSFTSDIAVGAHQTHMQGGSLSGGIKCGSCHVVPGQVDEGTHNDGNADVVFSSFASQGGLSPEWNSSTEQCDSVYCHGAGLRGGTNTLPAWTTVDGTQTECGSCHGNPPPSTHSSFTGCYLCHLSTVDSEGNILVDSGTHIDGTVQAEGDIHPEGWDDLTQHGYTFYEDTVYCQDCHGLSYDGGDSGSSCNDCHIDYIPDWKTDCTFCHGGTDNQQGSPPEGVHGETLYSDKEVGAHTAHLEEGDFHNAWNCSLCHTDYSSFDDSGHIDLTGGAEMIFSPIAGSSAAYNQANATCSLIYCHGNGKTDSDDIFWTSSTSMDCGSCHSSIPGELSGKHKKHKENNCSECHSSVVNPNDTIKDKSLHINKSIEVSFSGGGTYSSSNRSCSDLVGDCHGTEDW